MFYAPQNEILTTDMQKNIELRKPPIYVISILVMIPMIHITYMLGHTILYWEHDGGQTFNAPNIGNGMYYFTKHLHYWLASQPAPTLVCRVCCRTGGCWGKTTGSSSYSTVLLCASLASGKAKLLRGPIYYIERKCPRVLTL